MRQFREPAHLGGMASATGHPALETERGHRDFPSFILRPDEIFLRHLDVVEEDLVEVAMAVHQDQRPHRDTGAFHVNQQVADTLVLGRFRIGAREHEDTVGVLCARGPHLLPVDDEVVAVVGRAGLKSGKVGARARLGVALAPDVLGAQDARNVVFFLLVAAPVHHGRP